MNSQAFSLMDNRYLVKVWASKSLDATFLSKDKSPSLKEWFYLSEIIIVEGEYLSSSQAKEQVLHWLTFNRAYQNFHLEIIELVGTEFIDWDKVTKI